jgi:hypothetical protein
MTAAAEKANAAIRPHRLAKSKIFRDPERIKHNRRAVMRN